MADNSKQLAGLSNEGWIVVIATIIIAFIVGLSDDTPNWIQTICYVILALAIIRAAVGFFSGGK